MKEATEKFIRVAGDRIAAGEMNIRRYLLVSCLTAQADAKQESTSVQTSILENLERVLEQCGLLFQSRLHALNETTSVDRLANRNVIKQQPWQWDQLLSGGKETKQLVPNDARTVLHVPILALCHLGFSLD